MSANDATAAAQATVDKIDPVLAEMIKIAPSLIWIALAILLVLIIGPLRLRQAFANATRVAFVGLEVEFRSELSGMAKARGTDLPERVSRRVAERLDRLRPIFANTRFLWIDDNPSNNVAEIRVLRDLGVTIDLALDDKAARAQLKGGIYDLVLSDIARGSNKMAGIEFAEEVADSAFKPPLIFYTGSEGARPQHCFGLTSRPDELFNLILDALERARNT